MTTAEIMTTVSLDLRVEATATITDHDHDHDRGSWVNYAAAVTISDRQGVYGIGPFTVRHTAYIEGGRLARAQDAQDFDCANEDIRQAIGMFADVHAVRDAILYACHSAAEAAWRDSAD